MDASAVTYYLVGGAALLYSILKYIDARGPNVSNESEIASNKCADNLL
jgi:hypothetical protein